MCSNPRATLRSGSARWTRRTRRSGRSSRVRPQRASGRNQRAAGGVLPGEAGHELHHRPRFHAGNAATPWAPPTAEQIGLIGTHWSKGWIIENNVVSHSGARASRSENTETNGTTVGHRLKATSTRSARPAQTDGTRKTSATTSSATTRSPHCEQTGIVGSLGARSAPSRATRSMTFMSSGSLAARRWPASSSTGRLMLRSATTTSTGPCAASGWIGWRKAPMSPGTCCTTIGRRT